MYKFALAADVTSEGKLLEVFPSGRLSARLMLLFILLMQPWTDKNPAGVFVNAFWSHFWLSF